MKSTGIIRKVDELGRIVLPIELRNLSLPAYFALPHMVLFLIGARTCAANAHTI